MATYPSTEIAQKLLEQQKTINEQVAELDRLRSVLKELMEFNRLRNDRDAYLLALSQWGINGKWGAEEEFSERPQRADFGLE